MTDSAHPATQTTPTRLAREKSPYLLQHAHNPVDWYPWGEEAFSKARHENKPIFLSVGYSTCHWCHVMAHESFEDTEVARLLNRDFVPIKVDREERPDIDRLYMAYVQAVTQGAGGWPMSVWLTPALKPFYGGTYFPPEDSFGRPGFARVLESLAEAWRTARPQIEAASDTSIRQLQAQAAETRSAAVGESVFGLAASVFEASYDAVNGGFGGAPKFPRPSVFAFLLRHHARTGDPRALDSVRHTLRAMAEGGIHDHLGGGFHRYATDERWRVPHFEKMLYDQAQLVFAYLEAYQLSGDPLFASVARDTLAYVRRDLTGPEGQLFSAEDADSPKPGEPGVSAEGAFYTWTLSEVCAALGDEEGRRFGAAFGLDRSDDLIDGRHVLSVVRADARDSLAQHRAALLTARDGRPRPHRDDKAVTAWNGLMISAFARAYQVLGDPSDRASAERAADFVHRRLYDRKTGRLCRRFRDGEAAVDGYAEDYAFLIQGLLDLYEANFDPARLEWALELQDKQDSLFLDMECGGYFSSAADAPDVLVRMKEMYDGAEPAANSVSALNLLRLSAVTGTERFRKTAEALFSLFGQRLRDVPQSVPQMLAALTLRYGRSRQVVIAGDRDAADTRSLLHAAQHRFSLGQVVLLADGGAGQNMLAVCQPTIKGMQKVDGHATAYVCADFACQTPITDAVVLANRLNC
jgi:uncharacterized protein YyaL (SSP411 family)